MVDYNIIEQIIRTLFLFFFVSKIKFITNFFSWNFIYFQPEISYFPTLGLFRNSDRDFHFFQLWNCLKFGPEFGIFQIGFLNNSNLKNK